MSPINHNLLQEKADVVIRCVQRVRSRMPASQQQLVQDMDIQDIVVLNLERAVQSCVDIASHVIAYSTLPAPATMADSFLLLARSAVISSELAERMRKAVGMRNLLVHEYQTINWDIVWAVLNKHTNDPIDFVTTVLAWSAASAK